MCAAGRLLTFTQADGAMANVVFANWIDRTFTGACFPAFFTVMSASLSDVVLGQKLAAHSGTIAAYVGAGIMFGPWLGAQVLNFTGNPKYTALTAVGVSVLTALYVQFYVDETLEDSKKKEIDFRLRNHQAGCEQAKKKRRFQGFLEACKPPRDKQIALPETSPNRECHVQARSLRIEES